MIRFLTQRLLRLLIVIVGVSVFTFLLVHLSGDPVLLMLPPDATIEQIQEFRHQYGFDRPLPVQYAEYVGHVLHGNFGESLQQHRPAMDVVFERAPATVKLSILSMIVSILVAVPMGVAAAVRRKTPLDSVFTGLALLGQSVPIFWTGILLMMFFGVKLKLFPVSGWGTWQHMVLPGIALGVWTAPVLVRLVRSALVEVLSADYVRTAKAKGLGQRVVIYKHALKNAGVPIITMMGIQFARLLGGSVITESVFAIPGLGRATVQAIYAHDYPLVQAAVLVLALVTVLINFFVDICYAWINPQIHYA